MNTLFNEVLGENEKRLLFLLKTKQTLATPIQVGDPVVCSSGAISKTGIQLTCSVDHVFSLECE